MQYHKIKIAGLQRELPLCAVSDTLSIAAFIMTGDVEMTIAAAKELLKKVPEFDVILTPETKSIPLAYEMARQSGKTYVVARKSVKVYMREPVFVELQSITTANIQKLYIGKDDINILSGKRVLLVDDVISTGESLIALKKICKMAGGNIAASCAVLAEGDAANRTDIIFLEPLPLFYK